MFKIIGGITLALGVLLYLIVFSFGVKKGYWTPKKIVMLGLIAYMPTTVLWSFYAVLKSHGFARLYNGLIIFLASSSLFLIVSISTAWLIKREPFRSIYRIHNDKPKKQP